MTDKTKSLAGANAVHTHGAEAPAQGVKTGASLKHHGTRGSAQGIKAKTRIKAGLEFNHNGTFVRV